MLKGSFGFGLHSDDDDDVVVQKVLIVIAPHLHSLNLTCSVFILSTALVP